MSLRSGTGLEEPVLVKFRSAAARWPTRKDTRHRQQWHWNRSDEQRAHPKPSRAMSCSQCSGSRPRVEAGCTLKRDSLNIGQRAIAAPPTVAVALSVLDQHCAVSKYCVIVPPSSQPYVMLPPSSPSPAQSQARKPSVPPAPAWRVHWNISRRAGNDAATD